MKEKLNFKENVLIGSLLFGLFFGAGNLIFPVKMGQMAAGNYHMAALGFLITGVGLPILGVMASAISNSDSLISMLEPVGKVYAVIFTCLLYLSIGPLFAIPRTATVAFEVGIRSFFKDNNSFALIIFSAIFFSLTLYFSLRPARILDWIGKYLTPLFLCLLGVLIFATFRTSMGNPLIFTPNEGYIDTPILSGILDGYGTMDAMASLAFAVIIIQNIKAFGVEKPGRISIETLKSGLVGMFIMAFIYYSLTYMGATSLGSIGEAENGGRILALVSKYYFSTLGQLLLALIVSVACLKTAIGLITACAKTFSEMFDKTLSYNGYAILFTVISFIIANFGLGNIMMISIPALMFLYPISIVIIILSLISPVIKHRIIYKTTIGITTIAAVFDLLKNLPKGIKSNALINGLLSWADKHMWGYKSGFSWVLPAVLGFVAGAVILMFYGKKQVR